THAPCHAETGSYVGPAPPTGAWARWPHAPTPPRPHAATRPRAGRGSAGQHSFTGRLDPDVLRAFPQTLLSHPAAPLIAAHDADKVVAGQSAKLAGEGARPVRKQDLGLAVAAGIKEDLTRSGITRGVLPGHLELEVTQRNPACLAAPACVDQLLVIGQQL